VRVLLARCFPLPRQQLVDVARRVSGEAFEHVGEPGARIGVAELGRLNQGERKKACSIGLLAATTVVLSTSLSGSRCGDDCRKPWLLRP
jgi:hypothetical protein